MTFMKYEPELTALLCGMGKENPGLLSSEWSRLDAFFPLSLETQEHELKIAQNDPQTSGPVVRAMRHILRARKGFVY